MKLRYDLVDDDFYVGTETLRDYYMRARQSAGISIRELEVLAGISRGNFYHLEFPMSNGVRSRSVKSMLIALSALGFDFKLDV